MSDNFSRTDHAKTHLGVFWLVIMYDLLQRFPQVTELNTVSLFAKQNEI